MFWFQETRPQTTLLSFVGYTISTLQNRNLMVQRFTKRHPLSGVNGHSNVLPNKFTLNVEEHQDKLPSMYWLSKLHKRPYNASFIANSSSCTTTELSTLTSCLTAMKAKVIKYCKTVYERSGKIYALVYKKFW